MSRIETANESSSPVPFLARFAVARLVSEALLGCYDSDESLWTVDGPEGRVPLITHNANLAELLTKTKVEHETDDTGIPLLELTTKTDGDQNEGDDRAMSAGATLELTTKTHAQLESDDTDPRGPGLW